MLISEKSIPKSWRKQLSSELSEDYFIDLNKFLAKQQLETICPPIELWFNAFKLTPFNKVSVVILGQDPYHGTNQAQGLSFSVSNGKKTPPSLNNIFKAIHADIDLELTNTDLSPWAKQGVLLLNSILTVEQSKAGSHANQGWEIFTDKIIKLISQKSTPTVFMLWGKLAEHKEHLIQENSSNLILKAPHPSPLSAYRGFFECRHFSATNNFLKKHKHSIIDWNTSNQAR